MTELNERRYSAGFDRAALHVAAVVCVVAAVMVCRAALAFDSFVKGVFMGAALALAVWAVILVIPAVRRRIVPTPAFRPATAMDRRGVRAPAGTGLGTVTMALVLGTIATNAVHDMSPNAGALLVVGTLLLMLVGISVLTAVPPGEAPADTDEDMWLPSRDGDV